MNRASQRSRPEAGTSARTIRLSGVAAYASTLAGAPISLAVVPYILHSVRLSGYGAFATIASILTVVSLLEAGLTVQVVRRVAAARGRGDMKAAMQAVNEANTMLLIVGILVSLVSFCLTPAFVRIFFASASRPEIGHLELVMIAVTAQAGLSFVVTGYLSALQALQRSDFGAYSGLINQVLAALVIVICLHAGLGLWALVLGGATTFCLGSTVQYAALRRTWPELRFRLAPYSWSAHRTLVYASMPVVFATVSNIVDLQLDKLTISYFDTSSAAGAYQVGATVALALRGLALAPVGLLLAGSAELIARDPERLRRLENAARQITCTLAAAIMLGGVAFAEPFLKLWLGSSAKSLWQATAALSVALLLNCYSAPWYYYCIARGWNDTLVRSSAANIVVNAGVSFPLTAWYGLNGALVGSVCGNAIGLLTFWLSLRRRGLSAQEIAGPVVKPTLVALVAVAAVVLTPFHLRSWGDLVSVGLVYIGVTSLAMVGSRSVPVQDLRSLFRRTTVGMTS